MIVLVALILGIGFGVFTARKRNGNRLDMAQYAAGYGIAFMIVGLFVTLAIDRLAS